MAKSCVIERALLTLALLILSLTAYTQQFQYEINTYLDEVKSRWELTGEDISNYTVSDQYTDRETGITYSYLHQQIAGVRIFNAVSTMAIRDGKVVYYANRFHPQAAQKANSSTPAIQAEGAIQAAAAHLGLSLTATPQLQKEEKDRHRLTFSDGGISERPIEVELLYVPVENTFRLAWNVNIALLKSPDWWNVRIDAQTGAFLEKNNWNVSCDFGTDHPEGDASNAADISTVNASGAKTEGASSTESYNVFALPIEAPSFGARSLVTNSGLPAASPFGWHDTDGISGPEYTITRGNNVYAYEDQNDSDNPGYSPDGGAGLQFDFALDLTQGPETNQDAVITNLFYVNNMVHDILYRHGFNEKAGNFQANNYGKGGVDDDYVLAEAQDGGGTSNANFATPNDGSSGRMQMYLFPSGAPAQLTVHTPVDIAGDYDAVGSTFDIELTSPITAELALYEDLDTPVTDACEPAVNAADIEGKIVVVDRGTCTYTDKVGFAETAGAIAVIVVNNSSSAPFAMPGSGVYGIPSVMISQADGDLLKAKLNNGEKVSATLSRTGDTPPDRDGSLDNGVVIHEFGHGLSNRLTGGPSNSNCLFHNEEGGEGWSDWLALLLTIEPGDAGTDARGIGTYAFGDTTGRGIRRFPYSTDMAVNSQSYGDLAISGEVHNIGEIWSQALWDMTWKLIDQEGFDPDWYNGNGGNNTALRLVIEGMRLQPCSPGYIDARNAIIAADEILYLNAHRCLIWKAFAGRGMGVLADQGSPNATGDETEDFSLPVYCQDAIKAPVAQFTVDVMTSCYGTFKFTDQSYDIPQNWLWDFGDGTTSVTFSPVHTYSTPGTYTVKLTVSNTLGMDDYSLTVNYETLPAPVVTADTTICAGNPVALTAGVDAGNTANWSTGGTMVHTGTTFTTPNLVTSTTYTVQQLEEKPVGHVGPADNTFGSGGNHNTGFEGRLLFEALAPFRLVSVKVYAQGEAERTITLYNANGAVVQTVTVNVPNGSSKVTLNLDIPSAGFYSIGNVSQNLYRNNGGAMYPYVLDNLVRIYSSNATNTELSYYYYFYDWEVRENACLSNPATVNVNVVPGPVAGFTAGTSNLTASFTDATTGSATAWSWNFGDGSPLVGDQNPVHTYTAEGIYTVVLTVTNGSCTSTYQQTVTVMSSGLHNPDDAFAIRVFPNPANDEVNVEIYQALTGRISLDMTDAVGRVVLSEYFGPSTQRISVNTANLPAGAYNVRITGNEGAAVRKVTIVR
ncbi:MAG TPA: T9SS-dependent M36 family metallopeptidase [Saprospiraceae bacterium]|nr:T9SS-dependent M36 family metallopeptidase [Saprospiraceae bacterium]